MSALRAANLPIARYAPLTVFDMTITMPTSFSMVGKEAIIEFTDPNDAVIYRFSSEDGVDIGISGQVTTIALDPSTDSPDFTPFTFAQAIGTKSEIEYRVDIRTISATTTDFRFQGLMNILETHGKYAALT